MVNSWEGELKRNVATKESSAPNPYQAAGVKRTDGCTARRRGGYP